MRSSLVIVVLLSLLTCLTAWAGLDAAVTMRYTHEVGATATGELAARIEGLEMGGGLAMAATGSLHVTLTLEVISVDEQGVARVRMSFGEMRSEFMGERQVTNDLQPVEFGVDCLGRPVALEEVEAGEVSLLASGGVPVQLLGVLAAVVPMPEAPVTFGEEWTVQTDTSIPGVGDVSLTTCSHLTEVADETATVSSVVGAALPDMTTPNPMGGGEVQIRQGQLTIDDLSRAIDLSSGFVSSAAGGMTLTCRANLGGMGEMPLKVLGSFELTRPAGEQEQAALPPAAAPQPQAPAARYLQWGQLALSQIRTLLAHVQWPWGGQQ